MILATSFSRHKLFSDSTASNRVRKPPLLPAIWVGYVLAIAYLCQWVGHELLQHESSNKFTFLLSLAIWSYWIFCIYRMHKVLRNATKGSYRVSPGKAVVRMLIPGYNLFYWNFQWPREIAKFVNFHSSSHRMAPWWPGILLALATVLGAIIPPVRYLIGFGVAAYLTRNISLVLPDSKAHSLRRLLIRAKDAASGLAAFGQKRWPQTNAEKKLCFSIGLATGFCFLLMQPIASGATYLLRNGGSIPARFWQTSGEIVLICGGVIFFLDPLCERFRLALGLVQADHPVPCRSFRAKILPFTILVLSVIGHHLLAEPVHVHLAATALMLVGATTTTASTTYAWMRGTRQRSSHAALFGSLTGLLGGWSFAFAFIRSSTGTGNQMHVGGAQLPHFVSWGFLTSLPSFLASLPSFLVSLPSVLISLPSAVTALPAAFFALLFNGYDPAAILITVVAPTVFGYVGGLIINNQARRKQMIKSMGIGFLIASVVLATAGWLMWKQQNPHEDSSVPYYFLVPKMALGMIAASIAWVASLWIYGFADALAREEVPTDAREISLHTTRAAA